MLGTVERPVRLLALGVTIAMFAALAGCHQPTASTMMTVGDYREIAVTIGEQLRGQLIDDDGPFAERGPDSNPWIVAVRGVRNLTSDQISPATRSYLMDRVVGSDPVKELKRQKSIEFVVPNRQLGALDDEPGDAGPIVGRKPTHFMNTTLRSVTRISQKQRMDLYLCQYEIVAIDGELIWVGEAEFKRFAQGLIFN